MAKLSKNTTSSWIAGLLPVGFSGFGLTPLELRLFFFSFSTLHVDQSMHSNDLQHKFYDGSCVYQTHVPSSPSSSLLKFLSVMTDSLTP